jgi:L-alanine-DL-glutamate epimerase-like enolase superfamily enzyme
MRITAIHETTVPIASAMRNASIAFDAMTASALAIETDCRVDGEPVVGYAFDSIGRYGKSALLRERFLPRLLAADPASLQDASGLIDPTRAAQVCMQNEKAGGHGERPGAIALIEAALWDARAKAMGQPLWRVLASTEGATARTPAIATYGSCGHFRPGESLDGLKAEVNRALEAGYRLVKIKVGGVLPDDLHRIEAALSVTGAGCLAVDVNGVLEGSSGEAWLRAASALPIAFIEEPSSALDYAGLATLREASRVPIATGENLFSFDDARNLLRHGGLHAAIDRIQIDPLLAYGVAEYRRILTFAEAQGWHRSQFWPHAGHLYAAQLVAGFGLGSAEAAPDRSVAWGGYWDDCPVIDGRITLPDLPGVGFEGKRNLLAALQWWRSG